MSNYTASNRSDAGRDVFKGMSKSKAKAAKKDPFPEIRLGEHGRYQIKSGKLSGAFVARAFPKPPSKARGLIAEATGATEDAAIIALHEALDARQDRRTKDRRTDPHTGTSVPGTEEYAEALSAVSLTRPQRAMLLALSLAEADGLPEVKLAFAGSYKSAASATRTLGTVGRMIDGYLSSETGTTAPSTTADGNALIAYRALSDQDETPQNWVMHPELCAAVRTAL